jgi:hypothetical protein
MMGLGLVIQFGISFAGFIRKRGARASASPVEAAEPAEVAKTR